MAAQGCDTRLAVSAREGNLLDHMARIWNICEAGVYGFFPITPRDLQQVIFSDPRTCHADVHLHPADEPTGFAHLVMPDGDDTAWLAALVYPRGCAGERVGSALLQSGVSRAAAAGRKRLVYASYRERLYEPLHGTAAMPGIDQRDNARTGLLDGHGFGVVESQITLKRALPADVRMPPSVSGETPFGQRGVQIVSLSQRPLCYAFAHLEGRDLGRCTCLTLDRPNSFAGAARSGIYMLGVSEPYRRLGIGRAMMDACMAALSEWDMSEIELHTPAGNTVGLRFYEALGFHEFRMWMEASRLLI